MEMIRIGDVCDVIDGPHATPKKTNDGPVYLGIDAISSDGRINEAEYAYLSEEDYKKWTRRVEPRYGDLVFSYEATLGRYALIPEGFRGALGRRLAVIRPKSNQINIKWLLYYFLSPSWTAFIKNNTVKGSTVDRISVEDFPDFKIPYISREQQDRIVSILAPIDEKIENNKKINDNLYKSAETKYNYWFNQLNDSLPAGWIRKSVHELLTVTTGREDANFSTDNGIYPFFTCSSDTLCCDTPAFEGHAILIAGNGDFNVKHYTGKFNAYQRTYVLIPNESIYYGAIYFAASQSIRKFKAGSNGSIVKFITKGDVENISIVIPDKNGYFEELNQYLISIEANNQEINTLTSLRNWLLPLLMNGQATIAD